MLVPSGVARIFFIVGDVLVTILLIGFIELQAWPFRDWLQLLLFLLLWIEIFIVWLWGRPAEKKVLHLSAVITFLFSFLLLGTMSELFLRSRTAYIPRQVMNALPNRGEYLRSDVFVFDKAPIQVGRRFQPNQNGPVVGQAREILLWNGPSRFFSQPTPEQIQIHFITDENGFRNTPPPATQYPIVVTGDSFTAGMEVEIPWTEFLAQDTGQPVLNLAVVGYGPQAETAAVRLYGLDKHPEVIILAYFEGNDLRDAQQYAEARSQNIGFAQYQADGAPWNRQLVTLTVVRVFALKLVGYTGVDMPVAESAPRKAAVYPAEATINGQEMALSFLDGYVAMLTAQQNEIETSENWQEAAAAFLELQQMSREHEARFILLYIPSKPHVYLPLLPAETAAAIVSTAGQVKLEEGRLIPDTSTTGVPLKEFMAHIDDQALTLAAFAQTNGIEFLNLTPVFQAQAAEGQMLYLSLSTHWNTAGHQLAAQTVADYLAPSPD